MSRGLATLHYEARFGLARGAVTVGGRPHVYMEGLENDPSLALLGTRSIARLTAAAGGMRFLTLADGQEAVLDAPEGTKLAQGTAVEVVIAAEARHAKQARARLVREASGESPQRLSPAQDLKTRLLAQAAALGVTPQDEDDDAEALDIARAEALNPSGPLPGGAFLSVERTRGMIACDVDLAQASIGAGAGGNAQRATRRANEEAASDIARRLRLSGWAGLVVMDMIGRRLDGQRLHDLLRQGFAGTDAVAIAPVGRFGTLEFVCPWGASPLHDIIYDTRGQEAPLSRAAGLLREAASAAQGDPGAILTLTAPEPVRAVLQRHLQGSYDPLVPRLKVVAGEVCEVRR